MSRETLLGLSITEIVHDLYAPGSRSDRRGIGPQTGNIEAMRQRVLIGQVTPKQAKCRATSLVIDRRIQIVLLAVFQRLQGFH